jgi:hypothetical protein
MFTQNLQVGHSDAPQFQRLVKMVSPCNCTTQQEANAMLYKFKSKVTGDIIMLEPQGRQILTIWGRAPDSLAQPGILLPADMPAALEALHAAVAQDEAQRVQAAQAAEESGKTLPSQGVSLRQRAAPLVDMLQRSLKADKGIVWGV